MRRRVDLGQAARWEYFRVVHERYRKAEGKAKGGMLDEFCLNTGRAGAQRAQLCVFEAQTQSDHWFNGWMVRTVMAVSLLIGFSDFSVVMNSSAPTDSAAAM